MNKFTEIIANTGEKTLQTRAANIAEAAAISQQNLVNGLKAQKVNKELELSSLLDMAPESTTSLRPGTKDWKPEDWVLKVQNIKWDLWTIKKQLEIAEETYKTYFTE